MGIDHECLLCQAVEKLIAKMGLTRVKAERVFVQVVVEMRLACSALIGAEQPSFEKGQYIKLLNLIHAMRYVI